LHFLIESCTVFGQQVQGWMLIALLMVFAAVLAASCGST
jgi:hypothetical protein